MRRKKLWACLVIFVILPCGCCGISTYACISQGQAIVEIPSQPIASFVGTGDYTLDDLLREAERGVDDELWLLAGDAEYTFLSLTLFCTNAACRVSEMEVSVEVFSPCAGEFIPGDHNEVLRNQTRFTFDLEQEVMEAKTYPLKASWTPYRDAKNAPTHVEEIVRLVDGALSQNADGLEDAEFWIHIYKDWVLIDHISGSSNVREIHLDLDTHAVEVRFYESD